MGHWRLIALDMDGTLLDDDGSVPLENRLWIQRARAAGIDVTIATGRPFWNVQRFIDELELTAPFVAANGSEVRTVDGTILERHTIKYEDITFLHEIAIEYGIKFWSSVVDHIFKPGTFPEDASSFQWLKFGYQCKDQDVLREIWTRLESRGSLEVSSSGITNIEVNPLGISKASGLRKVCEHMGIGSNQVVTIGDGLNDVKMMKWAGLGIAMGNALDPVKQVAGWITKDNVENGVAAAIRYLLKI